MVRIFLLDAAMPAYFWVDATYIAVYTVTLLPTPVLKEKSPFEVLFRRVPNYSLLKPFGCACFPNFMASSVNKLQPQSMCCVFLGYASHCKGYRCLNPILGHIYISRHVRFHESSSPFSQLVCKSPQLTHPYVFDPTLILTLIYTVSSCEVSARIDEPLQFAALFISVVPPQLALLRHVTHSPSSLFAPSLGSSSTGLVGQGASPGPYPACSLHPMAHGPSANSPSSSESGPCPSLGVSTTRPVPSALGLAQTQSPTAIQSLAQV